MTKSSSDLEIRRTFKCSKRQLFDAWSRPSLMARWFFADSNRCRDSVVESDFRVEGSYTLTMYFADGDSARMFGTYREIIRYSAIAFTWNSMHATDSLVELHFKALSPNRTELRLRHLLLPDDSSRALHKNGWDACLGNLLHFIDTEVDRA